MGAALTRPLPKRLLPINRPAAAAAGRDFFRFTSISVCCESLRDALENLYFYVKPFRMFLRTDWKPVLKSAMQYCQIIT